MRDVNVSAITAAVRQMCMDANFDLGPDVIRAFEAGLEREESPVGKAVFKALLENAKIAQT
ncbi:MAG: fumarate hydratase, partial [Nitrospinae bacterium]|nr:fumarate hydratase [Nitrospinota bacterium]